MRCTGIVYRGREGSGRCLNAGKVEREGRWYCGIHDPHAVATRRAAERDSWRREREASETARSRAEALASRLGCGKPHYHVPISGSKMGSCTGGLILTEEEARLLADRLAE